MWSAPVTGTVLFAPVLVTSVTPKVGPTSGGGTVVLRGSGFKNVTAVKFATTPATYTVDSPTQITVTVPPRAAGRAQIRVTTKAGTDPLVPGGSQYTYQTAD